MKNVVMPFFATGGRATVAEISFLQDFKAGTFGVGKRKMSVSLTVKQETGDKSLGITGSGVAEQCDRICAGQRRFVFDADSATASRSMRRPLHTFLIASGPESANRYPLNRNALDASHSSRLT